MKFKYIKNINESGEATILLYDQIGVIVDNSGMMSGIDGSSFAYEMQYLQDKASKINVRINSVGGSVLEGYSIISAILNSKIPVDTYIDGLAASISAIIAMCGQKVCMMDYGTIMIHNPSGADQGILDLVKNTLVTILTNRTDLTEQKISKMMDDETYLNAMEAYKYGMVDDIISSSNKVKIKYDYTNLSDLATVYNKLINKNNKQEMNLIINKLGLEEDATQEMIVEAIEKLENKEVSVEVDNTELETLKETLENMSKEKAELEEKLNSFIAEKEEANRIKIEEMVNSFISSGQLEEDKKESTIKLASIDFDSVKNMLERIGTTKSINIMEVANVQVINSGRENWTLRDWEKKDSKGLMEIKNNNPSLYEKMYNDTYKTK